MDKKTNICNASENLVSFPVRAKYYTDSNGKLILASVQKFTRPVFRDKGWEYVDRCESGEMEHHVPFTPLGENRNKTSDFANLQRATRRAKINTFDLIMCNPDLNLFATFTYSPELVSDKSSYEDCYDKLSVWLSNRVQRKGLKYVIVPERTLKGDIHFHAIVNDSALSLERAYSAKTGRLLTHNGKCLFNIPEWKWGFTSAEAIPIDTEQRKAVAKYIFKYMGKQMGQKIGGRYVLTGGKLTRPFYSYGESETEFIGLTPAVHVREVDLDDCNVHYREWNFL